MFTSLRLERFKGFKDAELKLGPFTVLIGANASGKSNVRDAFRFLHGIGRGYSLPEIIGEKYGEGGERVWTGIRGGIPEIAYRKARSFALTAQVRDDEDDQRYRIEVEIDRVRCTGRIAAEELKSAKGGTYFSARSNKDGLASIRFNTAWPISGSRRMNHFVDFGIPDSYSFLGNMYKQYDFFEAMNEENYEWFSERHLNFVNDIKMSRSMRFFEWSLDAIRQPSLPGQDVLSDNGRNLSSVLHTICRSSRGRRTLLSWIDELTPTDPVKIEFPADPTGKVLATLVEKNGQRVTLASASDGTLRFLAFLASFFGPHPSSFYFFEELENGIHPTRLRVLLDLLENQVKNQGIQVVATTHSPQLLGLLSEESLEHAHLIYRLPDAPDARIIRVLDVPNAKDLIKKDRLAHLLASGWFETTTYFMQPDPDDAETAP